MAGYGHEQELKEWLESVSSDTGVDLNEYLQHFIDQGLTKFLLHDVIDEDWQELVEKMGHRILLKSAAKNVFLKAEEANLKDVCARLRAGRDELMQSGTQERQTLERLQADLSRVEGDFAKASAEQLQQQAAATQHGDLIAKMQSELAELQAVVDKLQVDTVSAQEERANALKAKEEAIMKAVQFGVSGATAPAPAPTQSVPQGYGQPQQQPQQQPPPQQQQQTPQPTPQPYQQPGQFQPQQQQQQQFQQPQQYQPPPQQQYQPQQQQQQQQFQQQQQQQPQQQQMFQQGGDMYATVGAPQGGFQMPQKVDLTKPIGSYAWYHGNISRDACEANLNRPQTRNGDFMVRKSARGQNSYSLSVKAQSGPKHYKIEKVGDAWKLALRNSDGKEFASIPHLINYYQANNPAGSTIVRAAAH